MRRAALAAQLTQAPETSDEHRVIGERGGTVDRGVEQPVVPRRREAEGLPDGSILGHAQPPGVPLEIKDAALQLIKALGNACR